MEKKQNSYYKAVSIISLVVAILVSVVLCFVIVGAICDIEGLMIEVIASYEEYAGVPGTLTEDVRTFTIVMMVLTCIYLAEVAAFHYLAYAKLKKYTNLTDEEAKKYNGKLLAWTIVMFLFSGILNGVLMICGYTSITKEQVEKFDNEQNSSDQDKPIEESVNQSSGTSLDTQSLDTMIERLNKLNKIKEMGGLTDEEYENLRKKIVDSDD